MSQIFYPILLIPFLFLHACEQAQAPNTPKTAQKPPDIAELLRLSPEQLEYNTLKRDILASRDSLYQHKADLNTARQVFTFNVLQRIIPYWYGTPWSFEGHTEKPGAGTIACGYFVSTTLRDAGLNLNRYKLAQQCPEDEARILNFGDSVRVLKPPPQAAIDSFLKANAQKDGLYFVGLGSGHVGYLYKAGDLLLAIHANYSSPAEVIAQRVDESVYAGFDAFYLTPITWNDQLIHCWLEGGTLRVEY